MGGRGSSFIKERRPRTQEEEQYASFPDEPLDDFDYKEDGSEQVEWFRENSNVEELIDGMSNGEKRAFSRWAEGMFMWGQQYDGWDNLGHDEKLYTQTYDDILDKSVISKGVSVVRLTTAEIFFGKGHSCADYDELAALEGQTILSKGNLATAAANKGLTVGQHTKEHEIRINIPAGSKGAGMWIGDERVNMRYGARQREFLMNRDVLLKVGKTTWDESRNVLITELTYVGRTPHDYGTSGRL